MSNSRRTFRIIPTFRLDREADGCTFSADYEVTRAGMVEIPATYTYTSGNSETETIRLPVKTLEESEMVTVRSIEAWALTHTGKKGVTAVVVLPPVVAANAFTPDDQCSEAIVQAIAAQHNA